MNTVICPHCGKTVEISQALKHQFEKQHLAEIEAKHKKEIEEIEKLASDKSEKKIRDAFELQIKQTKEENEEKDKRIKELIEQITELTKELRASKQLQQETELQKQKELIQISEKIQEETSKREREKANLEKAELQKKLEDTQKALEDAQRKATQKSQQLQGEVLELEFEAKLRESFPTDDIVPVPKGIEGADILQKVKNKLGQLAGIIIWETKRTKVWNSQWSSKLREDKRRADASIAILISDMLPEGIETFGYYENIWVASYRYAFSLASVLRMSLFELAIAKSTTANKDQRLEALFSYLTKDTFRNRFEAQVESIIELRNDLDAEQRATIRIWKKREMQIKRLMNSTATMYGELQGILGSALPSIQTLDSGMLLEPATQKNLLEE